MNPVKLFGGMLLVLGVCGMLLGSAMVPVSAPIWADEGIGGIGGGGDVKRCVRKQGAPNPCTSPSHCEETQHLKCLPAVPNCTCYDPPGQTEASCQCRP